MVDVRRYEYHVMGFRRRHVWAATCSKGGVHVWIEQSTLPDGEYLCFGGFEVHYRQPPDYMKADKPSQDHCWLLDSPCWHDGSSLAAEEKWIPMWRAAPNAHDEMLDAVVAEMIRAFEDVPEPALDTPDEKG